MLSYAICILGAVIGFTNLGEINTHLSKFGESLKDNPCKLEQLANSMLVIMVKGLFSSLEFPYAQFPCVSVSGDQLFWECVCQLERCGFMVLGLTCDGLSANRRLFKLHKPGQSKK